MVKRKSREIIRYHEVELGEVRIKLKGSSTIPKDLFTKVCLRANIGELSEEKDGDYIIIPEGHDYLKGFAIYVGIKIHGAIEVGEEIAKVFRNTIKEGLKKDSTITEIFMRYLEGHVRGKKPDIDLATAVEFQKAWKALETRCFEKLGEEETIERVKKNLAEREEKSEIEDKEKELEEKKRKLEEEKEKIERKLKEMEEGGS